MNDRINVVFCGNFAYPKGYAGTQLVQTAIDYFHLHGHTVSVLSWGKKAGDEFHNEGEYKGVRYTLLPSFRGCKLFNAVTSGIKLISSSYLPASQNVLVVYGLPEFKSLHLLLIAKMYHFKIIHWLVEDYSAYDLRQFEKGAGRVKILSNRFFSKRIKYFTDGVIILSTWLARKYQQQGLRTALVPISTGRLATQPYAGKYIRRNAIVYAGTFGQKDGVEDLIEAFALVQERNPSAKLELVGAGARESELQNKYANIPNVCFLGYLDDKQYEETLSTAHILCMTRVSTPYANAGFPYKVGDYTAMGRPILATRVSDIERYFVDKKSAMLVDSTDQEQMAKALEYLLSHYEEADEIGTAGRGVCEKFFNPEINGELIESFIHSLSD